MDKFIKMLYAAYDNLQEMQKDFEYTKDVLGKVLGAYEEAREENKWYINEKLWYEEPVLNDFHITAEKVFPKETQESFEEICGNIAFISNQCGFYFDEEEINKAVEKIDKITEKIKTEREIFRKKIAKSEKNEIYLVKDYPIPDEDCPIPDELQKTKGKGR